MNKIKILFLATNPLGTKKLSLGKEIRTITEKIRATPYSSSFELAQAWDIQPDDLLQELNIHRPHIVHISGHGSSEGKLQLVGMHELKQQISPQALKSTFRSCTSNIRLVILNACYSRKQAETIAEEIDCVIGMNDAIHDDVAITFIASFYRALGFGASAQNAFNQGKAALQLEDFRGEHIPQLLVRTGVNASEAYLVELSSTERPLQLQHRATKQVDVAASADSAELQREKHMSTSLFYCYAPKDKGFCEELEKHLIVMRRQNLIESWYGQDIQGGDMTQDLVQQKLNAAQIILLVVSPDFIVSDYIYEQQLKQALARRERDDTIRVIPIIVRPTAGWEKTDFGQLFALPREKRPVSAWKRREEALYSIAQDIRNVVEALDNKVRC